VLVPTVRHTNHNSPNYTDFSKVEKTIGGGSQGEMPILSPQQAVKTQPKDYQDEVESRDSKFKATWDGHMADLKNTKAVSYRQASVLLMSWHESVDDLHCDAEVSSPESNPVLLLRDLGYFSGKVISRNVSL
jgi:hypothetical protein